jgi:hypothetical protein
MQGGYEKITVLKQFLMSRIFGVKYKQNKNTVIKVHSVSIFPSITSVVCHRVCQKVSVPVTALKRFLRKYSRKYKFEDIFRQCSFATTWLWLCLHID